MSTAHEVLQTMITPAVLISASGTLVLSTSNRIAKLSERVRGLRDADGTEPSGAGEDPADPAQLAILSRRLLLMRSAMTALYVSIGLFVGSSLMIGLSALFEALEGWTAVMLALSGGLLLFYACALLVGEARLAARATLWELEHLRRDTGRSRSA